MGPVSGTVSGTSRHNAMEVHLAAPLLLGSDHNTATNMSAER